MHNVLFSPPYFHVDLTENVIHSGDPIYGAHLFTLISTPRVYTRGNCDRYISYHLSFTSCFNLKASSNDNVLLCLLLFSICYRNGFLKCVSVYTYMYMHIHCVHKFVASNDFLLKNMNEFSHFYLVCYTHDMYCQDENNVKNVQHHISARKGKPTMSLKSTSHRYVFFLYTYIVM